MEAHRATQHWLAHQLRGMVGQVGAPLKRGARACSGFMWLLWAQNPAFRYSFRGRRPSHSVKCWWACQSSTGGGRRALPAGPDFFSLDHLHPQGSQSCCLGTVHPLGAECLPPFAVLSGPGSPALPWMAYIKCLLPQGCCVTNLGAQLCPVFICSNPNPPALQT